MTDSNREAYIEEAGELLVELEHSLLELEEKPEDTELIGRVFRALHTIKGSGAMFGFDAIAAFTHQLETAFDEIREGRSRVTGELIGITLAARDHIQEMLRAPADRTEELAEASARILGRLGNAAPRDGAREEPPVEIGAAPPTEDTDCSSSRTWRIRFDPHPDLFASGTNPLPLFTELGQLGELSVVAHLDRIPPLEDFRPEECYTHWDAILTTTADLNTVRDVFIFVEDLADLEVQSIAGDAHRKVGEILADRGDVRAAEAENLLKQRELAGEMLVNAGLVTEDRVAAALLEQQHLQKMREKKQKSEAVSSLRVPTARLDALVNIVGELVTVQARLSSYALTSGDSEISFIAEEVERLAELLRDTTMSVRMLPIGETFSRFKRLVRDLSTDLGKKVELVTEGNDTELDKTVIEQLNDPLVHLVRNAVDHGIEAPEKRTALGKPAAGTVKLAACHSGAYVMIRISDDGAGMNREAIRARAVERGLIAQDAVLSDEEIFALTLRAGFSTAERVTSVSGRGVGMDVVQRSLDALRGTLSIASTPGEGTTITLRIPLTLAIIDGLLVESGEASFVVPLANISECIEMESRAQSRDRHRLVNVRGDLIPFIALRDRFQIAGEPPEIEQVIVAETRNGRFGFVVDRVVGDHQTVIKKLGSVYRHIEEVSGATILGDGSVALILDVDKIAAYAVREAAVN